MNQTGLSQSMQPLITSSLLSSPPTEDEWLRLCLPNFPSSVKFFNTNQIPYIFAVSPLKAKPEIPNCPPKCLIPRCKKCGALPSKFVKISSIYWKCPICDNDNARRVSNYLPDFAEYDIIVEKSRDKKPLFLFVFQNSIFFANEASRTSIGKTLDTWSHSLRTDVALVSVDQNITVFNLKEPSSHTYIDPEDDYFKIPKCNSKKANFEKCLKTLSPTFCPKEQFFVHLQRIMSTINRKSVCLCIFADLIKEPEEFDPPFKEILESRRFSIHLFSEKSAICPKFVHYCDRIRLMQHDCPHLVAPQLLKFLNSGFIFEATTFVYHPPSFDLEQICSRKNVIGSKVTLPALDGQSCIIPQFKMRYSPQKSLISFQINVHGRLPDGTNLIRSLNFVTRPIANIEKFDGVLFGCYIARKIAISAYFETIESAYKDFHDECINLISAWSSEGIYRRSILNIFRDVPLLLYALKNSDLFRKGASETQINAMVINLMSSSIEEIRRMLYPIMILPPLNFPHRLQMLSIDQFKLIIFLFAYEGIAVALDDKDYIDQIQSISLKYSLPITLYTNIDVAKKFLIEDNPMTFAQWAEKLEVEVNGRRF